PPPPRVSSRASGTRGRCNGPAPRSGVGRGISLLRGGGIGSLVIRPLPCGRGRSVACRDNRGSSGPLQNCKHVARKSLTKKPQRAHISTARKTQETRRRADLLGRAGGLLRRLSRRSHR